MAILVGSKGAISCTPRLDGSSCPEPEEARIPGGVAASRVGKESPYPSKALECSFLPLHAFTGSCIAFMRLTGAAWLVIPLIGLENYAIQTLNVDLPIPLVALGGELAVPCDPKSAQRG